MNDSTKALSVGLPGRLLVARAALDREFKRTLHEVARDQSLPEYALAFTDRKKPSSHGGRPKLSTLVTITRTDELQIAGPVTPEGAAQD